jgi:hypothetical protein
MSTDNNDLSLDEGEGDKMTMTGQADMGHSNTDASL